MFGRKLAMTGLIWLITAAAAPAQVTITARVSQRDLRLFFLSDFNFTGRGGSSGEIFSLTISGGTTPQSCQLGVVITRRSDGAPVELASGTTRPFNLAAGEIIRLTNTNLFSQAARFSLQDYSISSDGSDLRDQVLARGKLPSGIYRFEFTLQPLPAGSPASTYIEIDITNPTSLDLIAPGSPAGRSRPAISPTPLPLFRWTSNIGKFRLRVAEKLAGVHDEASPAEIIQDRIRFERTLVVAAERAGSRAADGSEYIASTSYLYPAAGAWPLEKGKTYYWQITGLAAAAGADVELPSEIWAFSVEEPGGLLSTAPVLSDMLATLTPRLGDSFSATFASGGELDGYALTGRYLLNGRWITLEQLQAILAKIASGEYTLLETRVE